ncbi:uncharacterized protein LOC122839077 isoform X4 [Gambusia affinis]|uniref:uncharacterized protein LOC122839077 isoform X4 n=1 Tax=Gambusia affinis TaxID=33528 RepID=UPI001CDC2C69|nr:uncharacterized protein LOC122839077 isoform X4 [Gambusia affinis]
MEKQQVALEETLMGERMTPGALEATGGPGRSKQGFKLLLALLAVMGLVIVVLVTAFIYCFLQPQEAPPARDPGILMTNCTWKESDHEETCDIFTADDAAKYLVHGWVKFSEVTEPRLSLIHFDENDNKNDNRDVKMTADRAKNIFFVFEEIIMIKNMKLSLFVPGKRNLAVFMFIKCDRDGF